MWRAATRTAGELHDDMSRVSREELLKIRIVQEMHRRPAREAASAERWQQQQQQHQRQQQKQGAGRVDHELDQPVAGGEGTKKDTRSKDTHEAVACDTNKKNEDSDDAEAVQSDGVLPREAKGGSNSSSKNPPQTQKEEKSEKTTFIVLQKNTRSLNSSERLEELFKEVHQMAWDAILISETWRQSKEIWETQQGHIMVESGKFTNKHGFAILLKRRWKNQINCVQCACEHVVAMSISVNRQPIVLMSVYMPHSGYPDHHVEKIYKTITTTIEKDKSMKIIGGEFNAELGPGEGIELSAVSHYTLNKANCRGEWMTQWLLENSLVALNTMYKKIPKKQVTYFTPKNGEKQLDYILADRKHRSWSKDAEANDKVHVGSDHRCVMAMFEIPKERGKPRHSKAPTIEREGDINDDEQQQKYKDLEQNVKDAEPGKSNESTAEEATETKAEAKAQKSDANEAEARVASAASAASTTAADGKTIKEDHAAASVGTVASEAQEAKGKDDKILALIQERKSTAKNEKEKSEESVKKSKSASETTRGRKDKKKFKRSWKKSKVQGTLPVSNR